jgi:DNA-binding MarR family transcriptional regulator
VVSAVSEQTEDAARPKPRIRIDPEFERTWPGSRALATECVLNLGFLNEQMAAFGESIVHAHGIPSRAASNALAILHGAEVPLAPSTIAERMVPTRPTITGILGSLERRRLVRRLPHPSDRRMSLVEITPEAGRQVERLRLRLHQAERGWTEVLSEEEKKTLLTFVARLQANAPRETRDNAST